MREVGYRKEREFRFGSLRVLPIKVIGAGRLVEKHERNSQERASGSARRYRKGQEKAIESILSKLYRIERKDIKIKGPSAFVSSQGFTY